MLGKRMLFPEFTSCWRQLTFFPTFSGVFTPPKTKVIRFSALMPNVWGSDLSPKKTLVFHLSVFLGPVMSLLTDIRTIPCPWWNLGTVNYAVKIVVHFCPWHCLFSLEFIPCKRNFEKKNGLICISARLAVGKTVWCDYLGGGNIQRLSQNG